MGNRIDWFLTRIDWSVIRIDRSVARVNMFITRVYVPVTVVVLSRVTVFRMSICSLLRKSLLVRCWVNIFCWCWIMHWTLNPHVAEPVNTLTKLIIPCISPWCRICGLLVGPVSIVGCSWLSISLITENMVKCYMRRYVFQSPQK